MKSLLMSLLIALHFLAGVLLQLGLSGAVVWAQVEASFFGTQTQQAGLKMSCPIMLSSSESGTVSATIANPLDEEVLPVITTEISRMSGAQTLSQTLTLAPHETQTLQWQVDASDVVETRLILVNIIQARYRDLDAHRSFCGILVFHLFNLSGNATLITLIITGFVLISLGGVMWRRTVRAARTPARDDKHAPLDDSTEQTFKACAALAATTTLALFTALPRWWGLTLVLDALAVMMMGVIFTDFVLFPKHGRN